jgi:hypothetical protein
MKYNNPNNYDDSIYTLHIGSHKKSGATINIKQTT